MTDATTPTKIRVTDADMVMITIREYKMLMGLERRVKELERWRSNMYQREVEQLALQAAPELENKKPLWWLPDRSSNKGVEAPGDNSNGRA
jgi:hypothetical protein